MLRLSPSVNAVVIPREKESVLLVPSFSVRPVVRVSDAVFVLLEEPVAVKLTKKDMPPVADLDFVLDIAEE